jgi:hypothetical protein
MSDTYVLVQRESERFTFLLRDCAAFGRKVFSGIGEL